MGALRLVHFSIQTNHLHLIVEARDRNSLARGTQALLVRVARALNRLWSRAGKLFADRYHSRALKTPAEVRHALVYVLQNARKHGVAYAGIDGYSSGAWFDGWRDARAIREQVERVQSRCQRLLATETGNADARTALAPGFLGRSRTWLLARGWLRHGTIGTHEVPRIGLRS